MTTLVQRQRDVLDVIEVDGGGAVAAQDEAVAVVRVSSAGRRRAANRL